MLPAVCDLTHRVRLELFLHSGCHFGEDIVLWCEHPRMLTIDANEALVVDETRANVTQRLMNKLQLIRSLICSKSRVLQDGIYGPRYHASAGRTRSVAPGTPKRHWNKLCRRRFESSTEWQPGILFQILVRVGTVSERKHDASLMCPRQMPRRQTPLEYLTAPC